MKLLLTYLKETNANVIKSVDGNDALIVYNDNHKNIDLILMDLHLPGLDGYEVTKIIRTFDEKTPIIAQTAYSLNDEYSDILKNGFNVPSANHSSIDFLRGFPHTGHFKSSQEFKI
jgi:CheY-like chemotaxis protein